MQLFVIVSNTISALLLVLLCASMQPTFVRRLPHVGRRYLATVLSGYVVAACLIVNLLLDYILKEHPLIELTVSFVLILASIVLVIAALGRVDIVFNGRQRQRIKGY